MDPRCRSGASIGRRLFFANAAKKDDLKFCVNN